MSKEQNHNYLIAAAAAIIVITALYFFMAHGKIPDALGILENNSITPEPPKDEPVYSVAIFQARGDTIILRNTGNMELTNETMKILVDGIEQPCTWSLRPELLQACVLKEACTDMRISIELLGNETAHVECS